jgi:hypothetical protein
LKYAPSVWLLRPGNKDGEVEGIRKGQRGIMGVPPCHPEREERSGHWGGVRNHKRLEYREDRSERLSDKVTHPPGRNDKEDSE